MPDVLTVSCARCQCDDGHLLNFEPLTFPIELDNGSPFTHWAPCPTNGQPILLRIT